MSDFACRMYHHGPWCDARCRKAYPLHAGASDCTHGPATHPAPAREVREVRIGEEDDEIVTHGVIHVERMSDRHIWANLGGVSFDFVVVKGKLVWRVQDMEWADLPRAYAALTPDAEGGR